VRLNSDWDHDIGFNVGLMFRPSDNWSLGLSYRAAQDIDFGGDATFTQIPTGNPQFDAIVASQIPPDQKITTTLAFPSMTHFGIATKVIPNWTVEFDVDQTQWDRFKSLDINFEQTPANNLSRVESWDNSFSYRLGANHPVTDNWDVRLGTVYDESPQPVEAVSPLLPDSDRLGVTFGVGYKRGPWKIDVSDMVLHFIDRDSLGRSQDNFNGRYKLNANLFAVNVGYVF